MAPRPPYDERVALSWPWHASRASCARLPGGGGLLAGIGLIGGGIDLIDKAGIRTVVQSR